MPAAGLGPLTVVAFHPVLDGRRAGASGGDPRMPGDSGACTGPRLRVHG